MNINKLMKQAQEMQKKMDDMQGKMGDLEITGSSGGGLVAVTLSGKGVALKVEVDPQVIDPEDKEVLEDLLVAAFNDAKKKTDDTVQEEMSKVTAGMPLPPGMKMPF